MIDRAAATCLTPDSSFATSSGVYALRFGFTGSGVSQSSAGLTVNNFRLGFDAHLNRPLITSASVYAVLSSHVLPV